MKDTVIISVHNYKTAGSTLHSVIDRQFKSSEILYANIIGLDKTIQLLTESNDSYKKQIKIVHGHFPFGWHKYFPQKYTYISFVRNPIDRVISDYYYNRNFKLGHNHKYASKMTLEEYLTCDEILNLDNGQTRFIAGDMETSYGNNSHQMLDQALDNIKNNFSFVGLTERFDESLVMANYRLSWNKIYYESQNITEKKNTNIDSKVLDLVKERNQLDLKLYKHIASGFDVNMNKIPFMKERKAFLKTSNYLYNAVHPIYKKITS